MSYQFWSAGRIATMNTLVAGAYGMLNRAAVITQTDDGVGSSIVWVGAEADCPKHLREQCVSECSFGDALLTPGLIDCHTHLVYGGHRAAEFEQRLQGVSYEEIARQGGGINSTVQATRSLSEDELYKQSEKRLLALMAEGVCSVEIKSGYGLNYETERLMLLVARRLGQAHSVSVRTSYLAAHATPAEYRGRTQAYFDEVVLPSLPRLLAEHLVDAVDAFCEGIAFNLEQTRALFTLAKSLGLPVKLHAEQLSDSQGSQLAAGFGALSCDHLEWLSEDGIAAMAKSGTVAVLLPAAYYFLRETKLPPIAKLREAGVPIAISTDCNPGSSPCSSPLLALNMACTLFRLTPEEAVRGMTQYAAKALGLNDRGVIKIGARADFAIWDVDHPAQLAYSMGARPLQARVVNGVLV